MVGVAQSVEHQVVALDAAGSSPVTHPTSLLTTDFSDFHGFSSYAGAAPRGRPSSFYPKDTKKKSQVISASFLVPFVDIHSPPLPQGED